ncbi:MAG: hypothetical protein V1645_03425 [archaeon]
MARNDDSQYDEQHQRTEPYVASQQPEKKKQSGLTAVLTIGILFMLVFGGLYGYYYFGSAGGQRLIATGVSSYQDVARFFTDLFVQRPKEVGNIWTASSNSTAVDYGVKFVKFESVGAKKIPAGATASFKYVVTVGLGVENINLKLDCSVDPADAVNGEVRKVPSESLKLSSETSAVANNLRCNFKTSDKIEEDKTLTVRGNMSFQIPTQRSSMKVYLLNSKEYEALQGKDFFKENRKEDKLPIKALYNGEPVEVGIGVSEDLKQPVVVGEGYPVPLVGVSLINRWDGKVIKINSMSLILPNGVTIDRELSPVSELCPFQESSETGKFTKYDADTSMLSRVSAFGSGEQMNLQTFECWLKISDSLVAGRKAGFETSYHVDVGYEYIFNEKSDVITVSKKPIPVNITEGGTA